MEITTAFFCKVPIVPVTCDDYTPPNENALTELKGYWRKEQIHTLATYGIDTEGIDKAYRHLLTLPGIIFQRFAHSRAQEAVVLQVVERCRLPRRTNFEK